MTPFRPAPSWLADAVFYQIYPQSFADSDGDGIGDFAGITGRLDHLAWLGVNTVWLNPCFASPFRDAGYDVSDYLSVAPRYGTDDDLARLVDEARRRGIRVLLDLVAGHTSDEHPWFTASADDPEDHRYIWTDTHTGSGTDAPPPAGFVASPGARPGAYLPNFFDSQPALNFGYARTDPAEPWRQAPDAPGPLANRAALREIMDHWLGLGLAGFRVDMAASLVKDDAGKTETRKLWTELRHWLDAAHPEAALLAEWGDPAVSVPAGFHTDFFLQFGGPTEGRPLRSLWNNRQGTDNDGWDPVDCFFDPGGKGSPSTFVDAWREAVAVIGEGDGHVALPTANHDFARLNCGPRTAEQLPAAFAFQLTWPTLPAIYYGDEIGMRFIPGLPDTEGSVLGPRYNRAGSRTPMQWDDGPNAGFSAVSTPDSLYLPLDPSPDRPTVAAQRADESSLLHLVRRLIALRRATPELGAAGSVDVLHSGYPFVYVRGGRYLVVVNPRATPADFTADALDTTHAHALEASGVAVDGRTITAQGFAYGVFDLTPQEPSV
ncbi:alpha-amylase family glycosyl hydrolase [Streptomyces scopuliridis]|uniref:Alpha-amylase family glycosyl hydrolase n=1 Tax=Streptomyces scopuliridis TaxID=452529 RepID=A0ACD4ZGK8_9ACTN|nr:alpha-amylase family glycosyl hydrolase [Streptomyces scopuliridis]WSB33259.1 alpha-amylase family glycosyl hydrolase [Streptomyces scopuliridis]WSB97514.1 alpha-amylase family glycosyl hydrolase [Streptomyces scopuliridis]WSC08783.1 alpha-amylase family glycosyl hydrolase [Streptomyces scopuliridis]